MRRKLFFCTFLLVVVTILILNNYETDDSIYTTDESNEEEYVGKIISIEEYDDENFNLVVNLDDRERVLLKYYGKEKLSQDFYGDKVSFCGKLEVPDSARNPGCFNYRQYLRSGGIKYICTVDSIEILSKTNNFYDLYCKALLSKKQNFLASIEDEDTRNFVDGILFGNTNNLEEDIYEEFKVNGTAHILAVSGLHIGIIYNLLQRALGKRQTWINLAITVILLWSLGVLAGWTPSVVRAVGMIYLKLYALYFDKRYDSLTALSLIALVLILKNPYIVFNVSFQMSFLASLSIIFIMPHIPKKIPDFMAIILAVNIGLMPYQIYQFNTFSITSFLANIPVVYLSEILLTITFAQFIVFLFTGINLTLLTEAMSKFVVNCNRLMTFGMDSLDIISPPIWGLILIYLAIGFAVSETAYILWVRKKWRLISTILIFLSLFSIVIAVSGTDKFPHTEVVFVDVGQGDCIHIRAGDKNVLIDGGGSVNYDVGKKTVKQYLLKNGVDKIDLAIATHTHTDHYKGLEELKEEGLLDIIETGLTAGKTFRIDDDVTIETIWPVELPKDDPNQEKNENCSVFMINYEGTKILITGDLDETGEAKMMRYYSDLEAHGSERQNPLKAHILKLGHHGSQYSTSTEFLNAVDPKYCVIQVGDNNYGHPHTKIIEKCFKKCIILLRNDIHGAIGFAFEERTIKYCTMS